MTFRKKTETRCDGVGRSERRAGVVYARDHYTKSYADTHIRVPAVRSPTPASASEDRAQHAHDRRRFLRRRRGFGGAPRRRREPLCFLFRNVVFTGHGVFATALGALVHGSRQRALRPRPDRVPGEEVDHAHPCFSRPRGEHAVRLQRRGFVRSARSARDFRHRALERRAVPLEGLRRRARARVHARHLVRGRVRKGVDPEAVLQRRGVHGPNVGVGNGGVFPTRRPGVPPADERVLVRRVRIA